MTAQPQWLHVAERLKQRITGATRPQLELAQRLQINIAPTTPSPVTAVILRHQVADALLAKFTDCVEIPESLSELESKLGLTQTKKLITGSREELSAWFDVRYTQLTINGLRSVKPEPGDVAIISDQPEKKHVISSIGKQGRVYMKGGRYSAWPNHLSIVSRKDESKDHNELVDNILSEIANNKHYPNLSNPALNKLKPFEVDSNPLPPEAIHKLENLLASGEKNENRYQELLKEYPQFLRFLVTGNWVTYVIPKQKLGGEYETDFLVMGLNSLGPQWVAIEIESPRHSLLTQKGELRNDVQHAISQIQDWREWLTSNVSYAQNELNLAGITNRIPGVVIIGRDHIRSDREPSRSIPGEQQGIQVHSWDWLLRQSQRTFHENHAVAQSLHSSLITVTSEDS